MPLHSFKTDEQAAPQAADRTVISMADALVERRAAALSAELAGATPEEIIRAAIREAGRGRFAIVSSFGTESAVLLAAAAAVDADVPVLLLDTGYLFPETFAYRDMLRERLGLTGIRSLASDAAETAAEDPEGDLFIRDPDACCALRKVRPLARALEAFSAWANGRKRYQGGERAAIPLVEAEGQRMKFNPLAALSRDEITARFAALGLPPHPLEKFGFASIGCMPCTTRVKPGEDPRAGRWRGRGKVECGLHTTGLLSAPER